MNEKTRRELADQLFRGLLESLSENGAGEMEPSDAEDILERIAERLTPEALDHPAFDRGWTFDRTGCSDDHPALTAAERN